MPFNLRGRNFLKLLDFNQRELRYLLDLARDLKRAKYAGTETQSLLGKWLQKHAASSPPHRQQRPPLRSWN